MKPKDPYENVPFVNTMTHTQLKNLVKNLWSNLHSLANHIETANPDVAHAIDDILDGNKPSLVSINSEKLHFVKYDSTIIEYNKAKKTFRVLNKESKSMSNEIPALSYEEFSNMEYKSQ